MVYTIFYYGCWLVGPMNSPRTRILQIFYNRRPASSVPTKRSKDGYIIENPQTERKVCGHYMILNHDFTIFDLSIFLLVTSIYQWTCYFDILRDLRSMAKILKDQLDWELPHCAVHSRAPEARFLKKRFVGWKIWFWYVLISWEATLKLSWKHAGIPDHPKAFQIANPRFWFGENVRKHGETKLPLVVTLSNDQRVVWNSLEQLKKTPSRTFLRFGLQAPDWVMRLTTEPWNMEILSERIFYSMIFHPYGSKYLPRKCLGYDLGG